MDDQDVGHFRKLDTRGVFLDLFQKLNEDRLTPAIDGRKLLYFQFSTQKTFIPPVQISLAPFTGNKPTHLG